MAKPVPIDDPIELRDALATDMQRAARRNGNEIPYTVIERQVVDDCLLVDAYEANKPAPIMPAWGEVNDEELSDPTEAETLAEDRGLKFAKTPIDDDEVVVDHLAPVVALDRRLKLLDRVRELCKTTCGKTSTFAEVHNHTRQCFLYPRYAWELVVEQANFSTRAGKYFYRSDSEAERIMFRYYEDICDRSNAIAGLPNWWVK